MSDKSHWEEHNEIGDSHGEAEPLADDVLNASFHELDEEPAPAKKKSRGVSPRLLAVLLMVLVVGGAGFAFLKMKARSSVADEPISATTAASSSEPVQSNTGMTLGAPSNSSADLLGGVPAAPAAVAQEPPPTFVPDTGAGAAGMSELAGQPQQQAQAPAQPVPGPPAQPAQQASSPEAAQVAALTTQMDYLQKETSRLSTENQQLREKLKDAAKQPARVATATDKPAANKPSRRGTNESKQAKDGGAGKRGHKVPDDQVITESRESRLASLSVRAIYPMNGRNARAWINVGNDLVEVSAGSTVAGAYVKSIRPEAMEVVTDAGVIRAQR